MGRTRAFLIQMRRQLMNDMIGQMPDLAMKLMEQYERGVAMRRAIFLQEMMREIQNLRRLRPSIAINLSSIFTKQELREFRDWLRRNGYDDEILTEILMLDVFEGPEKMVHKHQ